MATEFGMPLTMITTMRATFSSAVFAVFFAPLPAATQTVELITPDGAERLQSTLEAASLSLSLAQDGTSDAQDFIAAARADYRRLLTGLYSAGYYAGTISILVDGIEASTLDPLVPRNTVNSVQLRVTPGPKFTFGRADIGPIPDNTQLPTGFATGETAESDAISGAASVAIRDWRAAGRPLAQVGGQNITADHPNQELDVEVILSPGPELTFGDINVVGNEDVRTDRILAIAGLPRGIYDPEKITRAEANLRRTGAFSAAAFIESDEAVDGTLPLTLNIVEQTPRRIGAGVEYSTVDGLTLSTFWLHRNLLGGAESLRIGGEIAGLVGQTGGIDYSLTANFVRPATFRSDTDFYTDFSLSQEDEPDYFQQDVTLEAGIIRRLRDDVVLEYGVGVAVGEIEDDLGDRSYSLIYLPIQGTTDQRDDALNATRGYFASLEIAPFVGFSDTDSGARIVGDARVYRSFGTDNRVTLAARGQVGSILGADASNVPSSYLFYSGGGGTVRGQSYQSLAVDLGGGDEIGGTSFFGAQLEARVNVTETIGVVGFYDAGFVGPNSLPFEDGDWHAGAGFGLRYNTGIGPIRFDVATPTTGGDTGSDIEIYIGIGQAF